jgi:MFS transporter, DHA1 family, multidrug resistance protein
MTRAAETVSPTLERRILIWMCILVAINQLGFGAIVPTLPLYAQAFGVPASAIGMAIAIYGLARFASAMPAGYLSDWLGRRPALAIGGVATALGNLWCAAATGYPEFITARFVAGFGAGLITTAGQIVLADISAPDRRGRNIGVYMGTFIFAAGVGPYPGGLIAERFGLAAPFTAYGIAGLVVTAVAWFAIAETRAMAGRSSSAGGVHVSHMAQVRALMRQIGYVLVCVLALMNTAVRTGGLFALIPLLMASRLGLPVSSIGFILAVGSVCGVVAAYPGGWLADKFGRRVVIIPATLLTAASMLLFCWAQSYVAFMIASIAWSVASSVSGSAPAAYAVDSAPPGMNAAAISTYRMMGDVGYVIGPLALGAAADLVGPNPALIVLAALMAAASLAFALFAPETRPRDQGSQRPS